MFPSWETGILDLCFFTIAHYAGDVEYCAKHFLDKNKDNSGDQVINLLTSSNEATLQMILQADPTRSAASVQAANSIGRAAGAKVKSGGGGGKSKFVGHRFRSQLQTLVDTLKSSQPYFVRCLKPNSLMSPQIMESTLLNEQLVNA